jgi:predicted translin family RNA/ssDNA-binding protein
MAVIKVFQLDEGDWYAAETGEEAIKLAMELTGESRKYYYDSYQGEVSSGQMQKLIFHEEDGTKKTFAEKLEEMVKSVEKFPCFFATSEY